MKKQSPIKVLQVIDTLGMGGAETWLMELLRCWSKSGEVQMDFLMTSGNRGIFDDEAQRLGAQLHYVRYGFDCLLEFAAKFYKILREGKYDAIHDHQAYASGWKFLIGGKALPTVRVTHIHNALDQRYTNYSMAPVRCLAAHIGKHLVRRYATHITGTSRRVLDEHGFNKPEFSRIPKTALYCGFDTARFLGDKRVAKATVCREFGWPENSKIVLFAGRMDESPHAGHPKNQKNSGFAVAVGIECMRRDPSIRMLFAGKTTRALPILEAQINRAGFTQNIRFLSIRNDIAQLMRACDSLLFPSCTEGLGMVAVEAQAAGLAVLASTAVPRECVVVPELVKFEKLEAGVESWALALLQLVTLHPDVFAANRRVAESAFAIENSASGLMRLYREGVMT